MAELTGAGGSLPDEQRCRRSDGRGWRCRRPVMEGRGYCETHIKQASLRQKRQPVPDHLKLDRANRTLIHPKSEQISDGGDTNVSDETQKIDDSRAGAKKGKKRGMQASADVVKKRSKKVKQEDSGVVVELKMGTMEIPPANDSSADSPVGRVGVSPTEIVHRRPIRSKNSEPVPVTVVKVLPSISENVKAAKAKKTDNNQVLTSTSENTKAAKEKKTKNKQVSSSIIKNAKATKEKTNTGGTKKKNPKKCHWCGLHNYCVLIKCSTCKRTFFCKDCINKRYYCENSVRRECPVCQGECTCRACKRGPKEVKSKEPLDDDENTIICDPTKELSISTREKLPGINITQHLHMIRELLSVMEKLNVEKMIELESEAEKKGVRHDKLKVQISEDTQKECSFCKAYIADVHRSCNLCTFTMCLVCCHDLRDGYLLSNLENLKATRIIRRKSLKASSWRFDLDGEIRCPPKNLGGCKRGLLLLRSFYPFCLTKDLEESAKHILCSFQLETINGSSDPSTCLFCDKNGEAAIFKNDNPEHFMKHWRKGQPIVIQDVFQSQPDLDWDFGFMLCEYLKKSAEARNSTKTQSAKSTRDWCKIEFIRNQMLSGGITYENVWDESLKFKLQFSSEFFQDHFPEHYNAVIQSLPIQEYMNPLTGFLNLGAYSPYQTKNPNIGSYVSICYGGLDNPMDSDLLLNLCFHAYDVVNILVHATSLPISERMLNEVKTLMVKYNSQDHLKSAKKIAKRNKLEELFASSSRVDDTHDGDMDLTPSASEDTSVHELVVVSESESESESESDYDELSEDINGCGAHWDIFRREDVPMLLEYLKKYSTKFRRSRGSPKKVVHPLFDDVFYLDEDHKERLKEEFNVGALSFEQGIGEAVIIPAGCPYQMKKTKSCISVVYEFMSPESALESIKVSDEIRLLPVNHKAKGKMVQVKEMAVNHMRAAVEEMREVFVSQPEWSWPFVFSHSANLLLHSVYNGHFCQTPKDLLDC